MLSSPRRRLRIATVLVLVLGVSSAVAQPSAGEARDSEGAAGAGQSTEAAPPALESPQPGKVTPPKLQHFVDAPYPESALKAGTQARVVLRLDIDTAGRVNAVGVHQSGGAEFDQAAMTAAKGFIFTPAMRDGEAIAVRILYEYVFEMQAQITPSEYAGQVVNADTGKPVAGVVLTIRQGDRSFEMTSDEQGRWEVSELSAGDLELQVDHAGYEAFSSTDQLEAAERREIQVPLFPIREQADPDAIEIVVTGTRVAKPTVVRSVKREELQKVPGTFGDALRALQAFPGVAQTPSLSGLLVVRGMSPESTQVFFDGVYTPSVYHLGGLSSVVPTEMLDTIDFRPGNFDVEYGRGLGGIVDAKIRSPKKDKFHGMAQVDLIDARAMVEGPVGWGGWSVMAGARRSHLDSWLGPLLEGSNTAFSDLPVYYDYQLFLQRDNRDGSTIRVGVYGSDDQLSLLNDNQVFFNSFSVHNAFWNIVTEYNTPLGQHTDWQHAASIGRLIERVKVGPIESRTYAVPFTFRGKLTHRFSETLTLRAGPDILAAPFNVVFEVPEESLTGDPLATSPVLRPPRLAESQSAFFQPAAYAALDWAVTSRLSLTPGVRVDYTRGTDRFDVSPRLNGSYALVAEHPKTTLRFAAGVYREPPEVRFTLPEYGSPDLSSLRAIQTAVGVDQEFSKQVEGSVEGFFSGLDQQLSQASDENGVRQLNNRGTGRAYGAELMLRYKADEHFFGWLSYTLSRSERRLAPGGPMELFGFDQTHIGSVLGSVRLGRGWEVGGRFRLVSGVPTVPCAQEILDSSDGSLRCLASGDRQGRAPWFHQLDLRVEKLWKLSAEARLSLYLNVINAYNRETADLPLVPSLGVRGEL